MLSECSLKITIFSGVQRHDIIICDIFIYLVRFSLSLCVGYLMAEFRLIVSGKPLDDDSASLSEYGIKPSSVVQMVAKVHGG